MKYLPFIWANLWRKPLRTAFTLSSVVLAFVLLGLVLGLQATLLNIASNARADRIYTSARFAGTLRLAQLQQLSSIPGVRHVGALDAIAGSYQRPANKVVVLMPGPGIREVFPELPLTGEQWQVLKSLRAGVFVSRLLSLKFGLKAGAAFPVTSSGIHRADGSNTWSFEVLAVVPDISLLPVGFAVGNYDYLDQSRPVEDRGEVQQFWLLATDVKRVDELMKVIDARFANSSVPTKSVSEKALLEGNGGGGRDALAALMAVAILGVIMIMLLTANAMRHSIRERNTELAVLKTLGFSNATIMRFILTEAALPCLSGGIIGLGLAALTAAVSPLLLPAGVTMPVPRIDFDVVAKGTGAALLIAVVAATMPVMRITRLDVAAALARI